MFWRRPPGEALLQGMMRRVTVVAVGLLTAVSAAPLSSQQVRGVATASGTGELITGALVELLDLGAPPTDPGLDAAVSNESGVFLLRAPGPGAYRIRLRRIGFSTWTSDVVEVGTGVTTVTLEVPVSPIVLPDLSARGGQVCRGSPEDLLRAYQTYDDAVRALEPVIWTETAGLHVFDVELRSVGPESFPAGTKIRPEHYEALDRFRATGEPIPGPAGDQEAYLRFLEMTYPAPADTVTVRRPIDSPPPEELREAGYATANDRSDISYYAPTAATIASDSFRDSHCFRVLAEDERAIGLRFEPLPNRDLPDIRGAIWLTGDRRAVTHIDFEFTGLRPVLREHQVPQLRAAARRAPARVWDGAYRFSFGSIRMRGDFGGRLEFDGLGDGTAVTRRWELRIPIMWYFTGWSYDPPQVEGFPVALEWTRTGEVVEVLTLGDAADTARRRH